MATSGPSLSALRLLILSPHQYPQQTQSQNTPPRPSPFLPLLTALTSIGPSPDLTSFAGYTSHPPLKLKTKYYERDVGIWCDELPPVSALSRRGTGASVASASVGDVGSPIDVSSVGGVASIVVSPSSGEIPRIEDLLSTSTTGPSVSASGAVPASGSTSTSTNPTSTSATNSSSSTTQIQQPQNPSTTLPPSSGEEEEPATLSGWKTSLLSPPFAPVLSSLGAIILILPIPSHADYPATPAERVSLMEYISAVNEVKDAVEDIGRDVGGVFLLMPEAPPSKGQGESKVLERLEGLAEKFEDKCHEMGVFGWDLVCWDGIPPPAVPQLPSPTAATPVDGTSTSDPTATTTTQSQPPSSTQRNAFGDTLGIPRIQEVLSAVDWSITPSNTFPDDPALDDDNNDSANSNLFPSSTSQPLDAELQREMLALKMDMFSAHTKSLDTAPFTNTTGNTTGNTTDNDGAVAGLGLDVPSASAFTNYPSHVNDDGEEISTAEMSRLIERVVAIKEAAGEMQGREKEEFAKREVGRIMRELG